jgi:hypothetical protein
VAVLPAKNLPCVAGLSTKLVLYVESILKDCEDDFCQDQAKLQFKESTVFMD